MRRHLISLSGERKRRPGTGQRSVAAGPQATEWDGTNDSATYSSTPSGLSTTGPGFVMSFFFRCDASGKFHGIFGTPASSNIYILIRSGNTLHLQIKDTAGGTLINHVNVGPNDLADGNPHHAIFCADRTNNRTQLVIDGTTRINTTYPTANDIAIMGASINIALVDGFRFEGVWWEVWANDEVGQDVVTDLTKWRNVDGTPADLGADGSTPTGSQPVLYFPDGDTSNNRGTGGNATVSGSPTLIPRPS